MSTSIASVGKSTVVLRVVDGGETGSVLVPETWIARWEALSNVVDDLGSNEIEWTLSSQEDIARWVSLNRRMDGVDDSDPLPLSKVEKVVDVMLPRDDEWLLHVYIEPDNVNRSDLYYRLGRYVRVNQIRYPYNSMTPEVDPVQPGLHYNLLLDEDPAYGIRASNTSPAIATSCYPPGLLQAIWGDPLNHLASTHLHPLNTVTGVLHTAWLLSTSSSYHIEEKDREYMEEVPWDAIQWRDLLPVVGSHQIYFHEDLIDIIRSLVDDPLANKLEALTRYT